jgi:D-glycero-D-manno-heptose 1,7-bisphosphate phosphatase
VSRRAVFLDRDGVLNEPLIRGGKPFPPGGPEEVAIAPGAAMALEGLRDAGFCLLVVTNQPDVPRGVTTRAAVEGINSLLSRALPLDEFFICYHTDRDGCGCRKPLPGLILEAAAKHSIDLGSSYMVGDRWRDIDAGAAAGCRTILIDRDYRERAPDHRPDYRVRTLAEAADAILKDSTRP